MTAVNFDSYCGIYCGACSVMMSHRTGIKDALAEFFNEENVRSFLAMQGVAYPEDEVFSHQCCGCKTDTVFINCRPCRIRVCAVEKGLEHCVDCGEYPCGMYSFQMNNPDVQQNLPHTKCSMRNLERIKETGTAAWLAEQETVWQCPDCKTSYSWYAPVCSQCGRSLDDVKPYLR